MQTFLPYASFFDSAMVLDRQRLGKQRVEVWQLLRALDGGGWSNHPATKMWRGYKNALVVYGAVICDEWTARGYKDTCYDKITSLYNVTESLQMPPWLGRKDFHRSHQSNLLRKDHGYYQQYFDVPSDLPYIWPTV